MTLPKSLVAVYLVGMIGSTVTPAATVTQLTLASQLNPADEGFTDQDAVGNVYYSSTVTLGSGATALTFERGSGSYELDQVGVNYGVSAFASGTKIIGAGGFQGPGDGKAITIVFGSAILEFGLNVEEYNAGPYTVSFTAFDASGNSLGTFSASGNDPSALSFEGMKSSYHNHEVIFDDSAAGGSNDLLFGNIDLLPAGQPAPAASEASLPKLLACGLLTVGCFNWRLFVSFRQARAPGAQATRADSSIIRVEADLALRLILLNRFFALPNVGS